MLYSRRSTGPLRTLKQILFGSPLRDKEKRHEKLGLAGGLAILGADILSSLAYATEEIMLALSVMGPGAFLLSTPVACAIILVIFVVIFSYSQTVEAYPDGGGAYIVAKNHLGFIPALVAAGSLLMDYVLTVAVSIAAGARALVSLFPSLVHASIWISLGSITLLCWINLRGIRETVRILAFPLYGFIVCMIILCVYGFTQIGMRSYTPIESKPWDNLDLVTILVIMRAFSGGTTALTGIEAIANAGPIIQEPVVRNARRIYLMVALIVSGVFLAITFLASVFRIMPVAEQSLLSQLARLLFGNGPVYVAIQIFTAIILFLAANTAYADYPRLCAILARDGWLPKQLATVGDRLVFHKGIILLTILAAFLLVLFQANVHKLIPLYATGVLSAFTLSQYGMMLYWLKHSKGNTLQKQYSRPMITLLLRAVINGFGAFCTLIVLVIFFEAKFAQGAWLSLITIPLICFACLKIHNHYQDVERQLIITKEQIQLQRYFSTSGKRRVVVPVSRMHLGSLEALAFAREISSNVLAVLVETTPDRTKTTEEAIKNLGWNISTVVLKSAHRSVVQPLVDYLGKLERETVIILPEVIPHKWWQKFLHNETVIHIIRCLEWDAPATGKTRIIITVPYHLKGQRNKQLAKSSASHP